MERDHTDSFLLKTGRSEVTKVLDTFSKKMMKTAANKYEINFGGCMVATAADFSLYGERK